MLDACRQMVAQARAAVKRGINEVYGRWNRMTMDQSFANDEAREVFDYSSNAARRRGSRHLPDCDAQTRFLRGDEVWGSELACRGRRLRLSKHIKVAVAQRRVDAGVSDGACGECCYAAHNPNEIPALVACPISGYGCAAR